MIALILLCIPTTFSGPPMSSRATPSSLWAQDFTDRRLIPGMIDWQIPVTWFQAFNPFMIFAFTPLVVALWARQAQTRQGALHRHEDGARLCSAGLVLCDHGRGVQLMARRAAQTSWLWLLVFFAVITMGELYLSPIGLALVARVCAAADPLGDDGSVVHHQLPGNLLQGYLGTFFSDGQGAFLPDVRGHRRRCRRSSSGSSTCRSNGSCEGHRAEHRWTRRADLHLEPQSAQEPPPMTSKAT